MNFKQIAEQYPKAWERFKNFEPQVYFYANSLKFDIAEIPIDYPIRDLYDFMDSEGIYIFPYNNNYGNALGGVRFGMNIETQSVIRKIGDEYGFDTRPEAEEQAFTKAFFILENKLKGVTEK